MTDTDAGKRLSDAELDPFETWFASLTRMEKDRRFSASYFMREAWNAAMRHAALTANRRSVSEERAREIAHNIVGLARERGAAAGSGYRYSRENAEEYVATAIQQAVSECSGGGEAPPSQGNVERARFEAEAKRQMEAQEMMEDYEAREKGLVWLEGYFDIDALITQALTDSSGQMDPEAAAILRTLGCVPDSTDLSETDAKVSVGFLRRLIESSGQGTDGAAAMREAAAVCVLSLRELGGSIGYNTALEYAAKQIRALPLPPSPVKSCAEPLCEDEGCPHYGTPHHCISSPVKESRDELIEECVEIIRWRETGLLQQGGYLQARAEKLSYVPDHIRLRVAEENVCMDAMRFVASTLPLPVSADGKYVTVLRQELLDLLLFVGQMDAEDAEMGQDFFDLIARLKEIATPQPKQPDTGAEK